MRGRGCRPKYGWTEAWGDTLCVLGWRIRVWDDWAITQRVACFDQAKPSKNVHLCTSCKTCWVSRQLDFLLHTGQFLALSRFLMQQKKTSSWHFLVWVTRINLAFSWAGQGRCSFPERRESDWFALSRGPGIWGRWFCSPPTDKWEGLLAQG